MTEDYLQIMVESLEKKNSVLDKVMELDKRQLELALANPADMKAIDATMEEKGTLIDELGKLDDGFTSTYERIREEVQANPEKYKEQVGKLQELVRLAVEKGVSIEAQEKRNKQAIQAIFSQKRQEVRQVKVSTAAASQYYKSMSKINDIDPQLMDRKK